MWGVGGWKGIHKKALERMRNKYLFPGDSASRNGIIINCPLMTTQLMASNATHLKNKLGGAKQSGKCMATGLKLIHHSQAKLSTTVGGGGTTKTPRMNDDACIPGLVRETRGRHLGVKRPMSSWQYSATRDVCSRVESCSTTKSANLNEAP